MWDDRLMLRLSILFRDDLHLVLLSVFFHILFGRLQNEVLIALFVCDADTVPPVVHHEIAV